MVKKDDTLAIFRQKGKKNPTFEKLGCQNLVARELLSHINN